MTTSAVIQSAPKWEFMLKLDLVANNSDHQAKYWQMKVMDVYRGRWYGTNDPQCEAIRVYETQLRGNRPALRTEHARANPPFAANQFSDAAFLQAIRTVEANASSQTRNLYSRGSQAGGNNWVIRWMLYHVCRYRDGRNRKAQSINFHDDDDLETGGGPGKPGELNDLN